MEKRFDVMGKVYNAIVFYDNETKTHKALSPKAVIDLLNEQDETIKMLKGIKRYDIGELLAENIKLKQQLAEKDKKVEEINKFISLFDCDDFNDFKIFFGTCMLAPHEQETLIIDLQRQLHTQPKEIVEKIGKFVNSKSNRVPDKDGWFDPIRKGMSLNEFLDEVQKQYEEYDNEINID